ncbi:MAG: hypothetical protein ACHQ52_09560 [Candidatus Eisenbacteria bacterium]
MISFSGMRNRTRSSIAPARVAALVLVLAMLAGPGGARAADPPKPADTATPAAAPGATTAPAMSEKAAREKQKADQKAARATAKNKKRDKRAREVQEDVAAHHPWVQGANWMSLRVGTAAVSELGRPAPGPGFGFGYQHFRSRRWSVGVQFDYDLVGKYGAAAEIDAPLQLEFARHFDWGEAMRPYAGLTVGGTWHRTYRTGGDEADMRPSFYLVTGANVPVGPRSLMGADFRVGWESDARSSDPVFPNSSTSLLTWRLKIAYLRWQ